MRTALKHGAWQVAALAVLFLAMSAESCQNGTVTSTSGGTKTITITDRPKVVTVASGTVGSATASCQTGEVMLSGGYAMTTPTYGNPLDPSDLLNHYFVFADFPDSASSWTASVLDRDVAGSMTLTAHVACASGLSGAPTIAQGAGNVESRAYAVCPAAGMMLTGGGYQITPTPTGNGVLAINTSTDHPSTPGGTISSSWYVDAALPQGSSLNPDQTTLHAYSVCGSRDTVEGFNVSVPAPSAFATLQPTSGLGSASCQTGQLLTGAGFKLSPANSSLVVTTFYPYYTSTPPKWETTLFSLPQQTGFAIWTNTGGSATVVPICMPVG
jgi:hypothetical protein